MEPTLVMDDLAIFCCQYPDCLDYGKRGHGNWTSPRKGEICLRIMLLVHRRRGSYTPMMNEVFFCCRRLRHIQTGWSLPPLWSHNPHDEPCPLNEPVPNAHFRRWRSDGPFVFCFSALGPGGSRGHG